MNRREYLTTAGGVMVGTGLAGCQNTSGKDEVDENTKYPKISIEKAELNLTDYDHVRVEGDLVYDDLKPWDTPEGADATERLRTYDLYPKHPDETEEQDFSITVLEYGDEIIDSVPDERLAHREPVPCEVYGATEVLVLEEADGDALEQEPVIKAHGTRPLDG
jgi:hypothetical protein